MRFLLNENGLLINGVCSQHECWHNTQDGTEGLGETCSTAYLIRVLDELLRMEMDPLYGDMMERAIYNGLYAAQSPEGRKIRYYVPFEGERVYFDEDTYCCPCNYRRIIAELPSMIYYKTDSGFAVNLYTTSKADLLLSDGTALTVRQQTDYPSSGQCRIYIDPEKPVEFRLDLRIPRWCRNVQITVNGVAFSTSGALQEFLSLTQTWKEGDEIHIQFDMPVQLVRGRETQAGKVAVMRGPQLYCLNPNQNDLTDVDLSQILIDPQTLAGPFADESVRPNGTICKVKGWKSMGFSRGGNHNLELTLTEFPDPDGIATYFKVRRWYVTGKEDELWLGNQNQ